MRLSDMIEEFIKELWEKDENEVELKRNELAEYFRCAPSQINYVLSTRFTPDHGYTIESQRGGGGFIRIIRIQHGEAEYLRHLLNDRISDTITHQEARILCMQLAEQGTISMQEAELMVSATKPDALAVPIPAAIKDAVRARILRSMLLSIAQRP